MSFKHKLAGIGLLSLSVINVAHAQLACPPDFTAVNFSFTGVADSFVIPADSDTVIARVSGAGGGSSINANGGMGLSLIHI